jgi:hypothetical protein
VLPFSVQHIDEWSSRAGIADEREGFCRIFLVIEIRIIGSLDQCRNRAWICELAKRPDCVAPSEFVGVLNYLKERLDVSISSRVGKRFRLGVEVL